MAALLTRYRSDAGDDGKGSIDNIGQDARWVEFEPARLLMFSYRAAAVLLDPRGIIREGTTQMKVLRCY